MAQAFLRACWAEERNIADDATIDAILIDSTAFRREGTNSGLIVATNGVVGGGVAFAGNEVITIPGYRGVTGTGDRSITAWARTTQNDAGIVHWGDTDGNGGKWTFRVQDNNGTAGAIRAEVDGGYRVHDVAMNDGQWHHVAVSWANDGSPNVNDTQLYLDGVAGISSTSGQALDTHDTQDVLIGNDVNNIWLDGALDEIRISSVARSADWIWAVWMNSASNAEFNSFSTSVLSDSVANLPATDVGETCARLHGAAQLDRAGHTVDVFWGPSDGGTDAGAWANSNYVAFVTETGSANFSVDVTNGLVAGATNYFTFRLTRCGTSTWAGPSGRFIPLTFARSVKIQFCGYDRPETLTNFPALVVLDTTVSGFSYSSFQSPSGGDLRFLNADGTRILNHEIETWDTNGASRIWVQVPELVDSNSSIFARWGRSETNHPASTTNGATWSEGYEAVWHFNSTNVVDSTAFGRHGSNVGAIASTSGPLGNALVFDGASEVNIPGYPGVTGTLDRTVTAWMRTTTHGAALVNWGLNEATRRWTFRISDGGQVRAEVNGGSIIHDQNLGDGIWHHTAISWTAGASPDITNGNLYADGGLGRAFTFDEPVDTAAGVDVQIGNDAPDRYLVGDLDEVRISSVARSSNWIWAVWMNSGSNAVFTCYSQASNLVPSVTNLPATDIEATTARLHARVDGAVNGYTATFFWGPADGGTNAGA
ncbi:MAG: DUF2341 domain-containing protein, partial [Verrucomicrobiota bacterium]